MGPIIVEVLVNRTVLIMLRCGSGFTDSQNGWVPLAISIGHTDGTRLRLIINEGLMRELNAYFESKVEVPRMTRFQTDYRDAHKRGSLVDG